VYSVGPYSKLAYSEEVRIYTLIDGGGPIYVSSLSLVNIPSVSGGNGLGTEELDAIFVGKGQRT